MNIAVPSGRAVVDVSTCLRSQRTDRALGLFVGLALVALSIIWRYLLSRANGAPVDLTHAGVMVLAFAGVVSIFCAMRPSAFLLALPLASAAMVVPQLAGIPFLREFGYVLMLAGAASTIIHVALRVPPSNVVAAIATQRVVQLLAAYALLGFLPIGIQYGGLEDLRTRTMIVHAIVDAIAVSTVPVVLFMSCLGLGWRELLNGIVWSGCAVVMLGMLALTLPFFTVSALDPFAYFGTFFYCRLQLTFFHPGILSTFAAAMLPFVIYSATMERRRIARALLLASAWLTPIVVFASASRTARLGLVLSLIGLAIHQPFRRLAIPLALVTVIGFGAFYEYRCLSDVLAPFNLLQGTIGGLNGGTTPGADYFLDGNRMELLKNAIKQLWPIIASENGLKFDWSLFIFGRGAGITGYEIFGIGAHMTFIDLFLERGIVGYLLLVTFAVSLGWRLINATREYGDERRSLAIATICAFVPILGAAFAYDIRNWLFVWVLIAFAVVMTSRPREAASVSIAPTV